MECETLREKTSVGRECSAVLNTVKGSSNIRTEKCPAALMRRKVLVEGEKHEPEVRG